MGTHPRGLRKAPRSPRRHPRPTGANGSHQGAGLWRVTPPLASMSRLFPYLLIDFSLQKQEDGLHAVLYFGFLT